MWSRSCANPHLLLPWSSTHPTPWRGLQLLQLLGVQRNPSAMKVVKVIYGGAGSGGGGGMWELTIIAMAGSCGPIWANTIQPTFFLWPANSSALVWPGQGYGGHAKCLIVPTQQIASQKTLVEVTQANSNINHLQLKYRCQ